MSAYTIDDAADTLRMPVPCFEAPTERHVDRSAARRRRQLRQLRDTRVNVLRLREALANGWDIAPELEYEEQRLVALEAACGARHDAIGY